MTQEKARFGEQAVNKLIETILARLVNAERLQVRVRTKLKQLARGEIDGLTIELFGLLLRPDLRVAEFQFDIGYAAVNLRRAMRRKIELLHPCQGSLRIVIHQEQFTNVLQAELSRLFDRQDREIQFQQVNCDIETDGIRFHFNWLDAEEIESGIYITVPQIQANTQTIVLDQYRIEGKEPPAEFVEATIALVKHILSLSEIANQGTTFYVQQVDIEAGQVTVQATAQIDQFPSD